MKACLKNLHDYDPDLPQCPTCLRSWQAAARKAKKDAGGPKYNSITRKGYKRMKTSQSGIDLITDFEGCRLTAYKDQGGLLTIGIGHVDASITPTTVITQETAEKLLKLDLQTTEVFICRVTLVPLSQSEFDALVSLVFNIGIGNYQKSTLLKLLNQGYKAPGPGVVSNAADEFLVWDKVHGVTDPGLVARRTKERELFLSKDTV